MKVRIVKDGSHTRLYVDDNELHRVVSYKLTESIAEFPSLIVELRPTEIEVDVDAEYKPHLLTLNEESAEEKMEGYKSFIKFLFGAK